MTIQLHRLEGFYRVAVARGYARAARSFPYPITQPGVHAQVKNLEREIGTPLFERVAKDEVRPTAAGEALLRFCAPFFEGLPAVVQSIASRSFGGVLRVDAAPLFSQTILPPWLARLRAARPDVDVAISDAHGEPLERLRAGEADVVVDYVPHLPDGFVARTVAHTHAFVAVPASHPFASRGDLRSLARECFVAYAPELPHHGLQMDAVRARLGDVPRRTITAPSVAALLALVREGLGFSVVPWPDARGPAIDGVHLSLQRGARFPIRAIARRTSWPSPLVDLALATAPDAGGPPSTSRSRSAKTRR
jgi:DNA-binding transcriptional LysR family regulator